MSRLDALPPRLHHLMQTLSSALQAILNDQFLALYLNGSYALDAADEHSDVDFLVVILEDLTGEQVEQITAIHRRLFDTIHPYSNHLEGSYIPQNILMNRSLWYQPVWYLDNGATQFERSDHDNQANVYRTTREHGITVYGDPPQTYIPEITTDDLRDNVQRTMRYWNGLIARGDFRLDNLWAQPFTVMTWCRMMQTLATGTVQSKHAAVEWGSQHLDSKWQSLIEQSWRDRPDPGEKVYMQPSADTLQQTHKFLQYALAWSQKYFTRSF